MSAPIISMVFSEKSLVVMLESGILAEYPISNILATIHIGSEEKHGINGRNSLSSFFNLTALLKGATVPLNSLMKNNFSKMVRDVKRRSTTGSSYDLSPHPAVTSFSFDAKCMAVSEVSLFVAKRGFIYACSLDSLLAGSDHFIVSTLALPACPSEQFADCELLSLLDTQEFITDSHLVKTNVWPLYVTGTSKGRVFVVPLTTAYPIRCLDAGTAESVSCLLYSHNVLIICSSESTIQTWSLSPADLWDEPEDCQSTATTSRSSDSGQRAELSHHLPLQTFHIPFKRIVALKQPQCLSESMENVKEFEWREKWNFWEQLLIGQLEDDTVVLISLKEEAVVCAFYGMKGEVKEALVHVLFDYLFLNCGDGDCYVYNMMTQQLERIISFFDSPFRAYRKSKSITLQEEGDLLTSESHQLLEFNIASFGARHHRSRVWVEYPVLGAVQYPALCFNIGEIAQYFTNLAELPDQAEFIISMLNFWTKSKNCSENEFQEQLQVLLHVRELSVATSIGTFGLEGALSFHLPGKRSKWEASGYISALLSASLLSVLTSCVHFKSSLKPLIQRYADSHILTLRNSLPNFQRPSPVVLGYEVLCGTQAAYELLRSVLQQFSLEEKEDMMDQWMLLFTSSAQFYQSEGEEPRSPGPPSSIASWKSINPIKYVDLTEALSIVMIGVLALSGAVHNCVHDFMSTLRWMLQSNHTGYIMAATLLLHDGIKRWRQFIDTDLYTEITTVLLHLYHANGLAIRSLARKALLSIGKCDLLAFCNVLKHEVTKLANHREYPESVLTILAAFVHKHFPRILFVLPSFIEVIMRSLDPREILLRKICIGKATDALELLVKRFPMVSFEPHHQLLAIGTSNNQIIIYDLKSATQWKELTGHQGPVSAVSFSPTGATLASYSTLDMFLKFWKIEAWFLGLGVWNVRNSKTVTMEPVAAHVKSTLELLTTISIVWKGKETVQLTREDGNAYVFTG